MSHGLCQNICEPEAATTFVCTKCFIKSRFPCADQTIQAENAILKEIKQNNWRKVGHTTGNSQDLVLWESKVALQSRPSLGNGYSLLFSWYPLGHSGYQLTSPHPSASLSPLEDYHCIQKHRGTWKDPGQSTFPSIPPLILFPWDLPHSAHTESKILQAQISCGMVIQISCCD
jgi:hypothetical protein